MDKRIAVFGTGKIGDGHPVFALAGRVGEILAETGFVVVNGGYGGTMLACARGARQRGGEVIGVTCSAFGRSGANEYVTTEVVTDSLDERLNKLIELVDGYVVLPGGTGTLVELAKVWELRNKKFPEADKPIALVGDFWKPVVELIESIDRDSCGVVEFVAEAEHLGDFFEEALK